MGKKILAGVGVLAAAIYIVNPTAGIYELLPDNLPFVGNLDEATATAILIWGAKTIFGKDASKEQNEILEKGKNNHF